MNNSWTRTDQESGHRGEIKLGEVGNRLEGPEGRSVGRISVSTVHNETRSPHTHGVEAGLGWSRSLLLSVQRQFSKVMQFSSAEAISDRNLRYAC